MWMKSAMVVTVCVLTVVVSVRFLFGSSLADPNGGFRGDVSKLDLVGILAYLSKPALDFQPVVDAAGGARTSV